MPEILRYAGFGKESSYGVGVPAQFHIDPTAISMDSPSDPNMEYIGGMGRMPNKFAPGMYITSGGVEFAGDISTLYYIMWLALGTKVTSAAGITPVTGEAIGSTDSNGNLSGTLANTQVNPGTVAIYDSNPTQVLEDNGAGALVEVGASGASGIIDYETGDFVIRNSTVSDAHTADYDHGEYVHTINPTPNVAMPSFTLRAGKDVFEQVFLGAVINSLGITVEREWMNISLDLLGSKDQNATLEAKEDLKLVAEHPVPFHKVCLWQADYGGSLSDISADVDSLTINIVNNASVEEGVGLCSRFPQKAFTGALDITGEIVLDFETLDYLQDFWGGTTEPTDDSTKKVFRVTMDAGGFGDATLDFYQAYFQSVAKQPSGRDRLKQTLTFKCLWDPLAADIMQAVFNNLQNYS